MQLKPRLQVCSWAAHSSMAVGLTPRRRFVLVLPTENDLSLFTAVEAWLERTPFVQRAVCVTLNYRCARGCLSHHCARAWGCVEPQTKMNLFDKYKEAVLAMLKQEEDDIRCSQLALLPAGGQDSVTLDCSNTCV